MRKKNSHTKYRIVSMREEHADEYGADYTKVLCLQGKVHATITFSSMFDFENLPPEVAAGASFSACDCKEHPESAPGWLERKLAQHLRREQKRPIVNHAHRS